jgi:hypothetical protein
MEGNIRKLKKISYNEEVHSSCIYLRMKSKRMEPKGHVKFSEDVRSTYIILAVRTERKTPFGKSWMKMKTQDRRMCTGFI